MHNFNILLDLLQPSEHQADFQSVLYNMYFILCLTKHKFKQYVYKKFSLKEKSSKVESSKNVCFQEL